MPDYPQFTSVEQRGDEIIIVGEKHYNRDSQNLVSRVIDNEDPKTVAVEKPPHREAFTGGMGEAASHAKNTSLPLLNIDKRYSFPPGVIHDANEFSCDVKENGDVDRQAILDARQRIFEKHGRETYHEMYTDRELVMAGHLQAATSEFETPVLAVVGAFHVPALVTLYDRVDEKPLSEKRIQTNERETVSQEACTVES